MDTILYWAEKGPTTGVIYGADGVPAVAAFIRDGVTYKRWVVAPFQMSIDEAIQIVDEELEDIQ